MVKWNIAEKHFVSFKCCAILSMMKSVLPTPSHPGWLSFFCAVGEEGRGREVRGKEGRVKEGCRGESREEGKGGMERGGDREGEEMGGKREEVGGEGRDKDPGIP